MYEQAAGPDPSDEVRAEEISRCVKGMDQEEFGVYVRRLLDLGIVMVNAINERFDDCPDDVTDAAMAYADAVMAT